MSGATTPPQAMHAAFERRSARLRERIERSRAPVVWLRGMAGTGKTRLLGELVPESPAPGTEPALLLDSPDAMALEQAMDASGVLRGHRPQRVIVASRVTDAVGAVLLTPRVYGLVDVIDDAELFVTAADLGVDPGRAEVSSLTAGWPVLVDAYARGCGDEVRRMLPGFLQREVLPDLAHEVVIALFGALTSPLSPAAVVGLFDASPAAHPLLEPGPAGVTVAGRWPAEALLRLRARAHVLPPAVRAGLVDLYTRLADPVRSIASLLALGQVEQATEVFERAGGIFFGYRHGFDALEQVLDCFGPEWERRTESLYFARLSLLIKSGRPHEAQIRLQARFPGLPIDLRGQRLPQLPYALLTTLELSLDLDEMPPIDIVTGWSRLESMLPPADRLARGLLYNTMALGFLQADALSEARQLSLEALEVYEREGSPYLVHYMQLHLCDIALRQSALREAGECLARARAALDRSGWAFNSEYAILECFAARIGYEEGRFETVPSDVESLLAALLRGDSWPDLIATMTAHLVYAAYWQRGLRAALDRLDQCVLTLSRRHGPLQRHALTLVRIRVYQMARRHAEAQAHLEEYELEAVPGRFVRLAAEVGLIRLRQLLLRERTAEQALPLAQALAGAPGLGMRQRVSLSVLQASVHHHAGESAAARRQLASALRHAEAENLIGVLVEEGPFLERLLPGFIAQAGPAHARLAAFADRVLRLLHSLPAAPVRSQALAGVTRQEHRVLSYLIDGYTNKEIARALSLSESAVKFHLRNLFRKLEVRSRAALREAVRARGLVP